MPKQTSLFSDNDYISFFDIFKQRIRTAQVRAALAVNQELIHLSCQIGCEILQRQDAEGWRSKIVERLATDGGKQRPSR